MVTIQQLKDWIIANCPDHIREREDGGWAYDPCGVVWYDAYAFCDTADQALEGLITTNLSGRTRRKQAAEIENQRLRLEIETLKLEVLQLKAEREAVS
jgi:hypothetical protein